MPKLTAVVLTYNKGAILPRMAKSLATQSRKADQVILVDDKSTDNTRHVIKQLPSHWKRVELAKNVGQASARNAGFIRATGTYLIFLDGDILMRSDMLKLMEVTLAAHPNRSFVYCPYKRTGTRTDHVRSRVFNANALYGSNYISTMSMCVKSHLPNPPFDVALRRYEDWDLWIRMAKAGRKGMLLEQELFTAFYNARDLSGVSESKKWYDIVRKKHGFR